MVKNYSLQCCCISSSHLKPTTPGATFQYANNPCATSTMTTMILATKLVGFIYFNVHGFTIDIEPTELSVLIEKPVMALQMKKSWQACPNFQFPQTAWHICILPHGPTNTTSLLFSPYWVHSEQKKEPVRTLTRMLPPRHLQENPSSDSSWRVRHIWCWQLPHTLLLRIRQCSASHINHCMQSLMFLYRSLGTQSKFAKALCGKTLSLMHIGAAGLLDIIIQISALITHSMTKDQININVTNCDVRSRVVHVLKFGAHFRMLPCNVMLTSLFVTY